MLYNGTSILRWRIIQSTRFVSSNDFFNWKNLYIIFSKILTKGLTKIEKLIEAIDELKDSGLTLKTILKMCRDIYFKNERKKELIDTGYNNTK